uniref:Bm6425 n=1 Tax=Brugia malayi TaxID=6279 RepID=A0A1I9G8M0_BRUMA|nr:Bm6425 [Brugia malayi]
MKYRKEYISVWRKQINWKIISGYCFDRQGMYKASMMKGQSKMFADRIAEIPEGEDIWKY